MIKKIIFSICTLFLLQNISVAEELTFAQIGDVHYTLGDAEMDRYMYFLSLSLKQTDPDFAVFLGDNIDKSREADIIGFMRNVYSIKVPYYIVLGNNDAHKLNGIEKNTYWDIVTAFNNNQKGEKQYYYFKPNNDFICAVLDDTPNFARSTHGEIPEEQLVWLEELLNKYPNKLFIIFHHTPLVPPRIEYKLSMVNSEKYESILKNHKNIIAVSAGQYHQSSVTEDENGVRHITAPAFKDAPHSYQLIKIKYDKNKFKSPKDIEFTVKEVKV